MAVRFHTPRSVPGSPGPVGVAAALVAGVGLLYLLGSLTGWYGGRLAQPVGNVTMIAGPLTGGLVAIWAARGLRGRSRIGWTLTGLAGVAWGCGQVSIAWYEIVLAEEVPFPGPPDAGFLAAPLLLAIGLGIMPSLAGSSLSRARELLDACLVTASVFAVSWSLTFGPLFRAGSNSAWAQIVSLAYPATDLLIASLVLVLVRRDNVAGRRAWQLLLAGVMLFAAADTSYAVLQLHDGYATGMVVDVGWICGYLLLGVAALAAARSDSSEQGRRGVVALAQPYLLVCGAAAALVIAHSAGRLDSVLVADGALLVLVLLGRQWLAVRDVARLSQEIAAREEHLSSLVNGSASTLTICSPDWTIRWQSPAAGSLLGYLPRQLEGTSFLDLLPEQDRERVLNQLLIAQRSPTSAVECRLRTAAGTYVHTESAVSDHTETPSVAGTVLSTRNVDDRVALQRQLHHQAFHDSLTGLANRALFHDRVAHALDARQPLAAILLIDLDGFKEVNDTLGHPVGDELLTQVAERLRALTRPGDTVARLGGDEFGVALDVAQQQPPEMVAQRLVDGLSAPYRLGGHVVHVGASIGIAVAQHDSSAEELLRNSDLAMYAAKHAGKGRYAVYRPEMIDAALDRLRLRATLS